MRRNFLYKKDHVERARQLRRAMTPAERKLWYEFLRYQKPRFYSQRPIGKFIADFYCAKAKLVIELDGASHTTKQGRAYDEERTAFFQGLEVSVVRFTNLEVMKSFESVCRAITDALQTKTSLA
jgi:very-short-patch-repair endonuclease